MPGLLLTTPCTKIRNLKETDLDAFLQYRSNPEVTKYQGFDVFTPAQAKAFIAAHKNKHLGRPGEWVQYGIELVGTGQFIGDCGIRLHAAGPLTAEIGITISPAHQRRGYAKEAMQVMIGFLFREKAIQRIVETVDAENQASIQLLKSLSFRQEGQGPENIFFKGKWGREFRFSLSKNQGEQPGFLPPTVY